MDVPLIPERRTALHAGHLLLARVLTEAAKRNDAAGKKAYGDGCRAEAAQVEGEIQRIATTTTASVEMNAQQVGWAGTGVALYIHNLRAAAGTMKGLLKDDLAARFVEEADRLDQTFLPLFRDTQTVLPMPVADGKAAAAGAGPEARALDAGAILASVADPPPPRPGPDAVRRLRAAAQGDGPLDEPPAAT